MREKRIYSQHSNTRRNDNAFVDGDKDGWGRVREYDDKAMRVLGRVLAPLFCVYIGYSLLYQKHKGWCGPALPTLLCVRRPCPTEDVS